MNPSPPLILHHSFHVSKIGDVTSGSRPNLNLREHLHDSSNSIYDIVSVSCACVPEPCRRVQKRTLLEHIILENSRRPLWLWNDKSHMGPQIYPLRSHVGCTSHWAIVQQAWLSLVVLPSPPFVRFATRWLRTSYDILQHLTTSCDHA